MLSNPTVNGLTVSFSKPQGLDCLTAIMTAWHHSPLRWAAASTLQQAVQLITNSTLCISLSDANGTLLWYGINPQLQQQLLQTTNTPPTIPPYYGMEWVRYCAPIIHPQSGLQQGMLTLATLRPYHTPIGEMAAMGLAQDIAQRLPHYAPCAELEIRALGKQPSVRFRGQVLHLSPRMIEILCILALNPDGVTLEACHAMLYGDEQVATTTLKAELSHLRTLLDGRISSRVYRLQGSVWVDFIEVWNALRQQHWEIAHNLYRGELLPHSLSPEIGEWRNCIATLMHKYQRH